MKQNIIEKVMAEHPLLGEFVNGMEFIKDVHSIYKYLGGVKNANSAKGFIKTIADENEVSWCYVVQFLSYLLEKIDKSGIITCKENKEDLDWEQVCKKCYPKELKLVKIKRAFKDFFYLVALNNNDNIDALLEEFALNNYGWQKIVVKVVGLYEEILSTNTEYVEPSIVKEDIAEPIAEEVAVVDTSITEEKASVEEPKKVITTTSISAVSDDSEEHSSDKTKVVENKKYARHRTIVLKYPNGEKEDFPSPKAVSDSTGIPMGAIRKNVSGHSTYIRFNKEKYQASYKDAC